ncbi:MAG: type II secretion system F family protein [Pseudomonadota bacterium]
MQLTTKNYPLRLYTWSGWSSDHKKITGEIHAHSITLARLELLQQGMTVTFIRKKMQPWLFKQSKILSRDIAMFFRQLATLVNAGISLVQCLDVLSQNHQHPKLQLLIQSLKNDVEAGNNLAHAMRAHPGLFDHLTCQLTYIAEQTGTLDTLLTRLANHQEKTLALKNEIKQALAYPCFILIMALLITTAMLIFVIPHFVEIFANFQVKLPALTRHVIQFSTFIINDYWLAPLPVIVNCAIIYYYKKSPTLKKNLDTVLLKTPWLGTFLKKVIFTRITRTLATMLTAGLSITNALTMLSEISTNHIIQTALTQLHSDINAGKRIHEALQNAAIFPPLMTRMIKIGEESGTLETMLEKIAVFYEADIAYWINNFSHLLEPLIIMILGVLIGGLVIAMYLPIFKLGTVI